MRQMRMSIAKLTHILESFEIVLYEKYPDIKGRISVSLLKETMLKKKIHFWQKKMSFTASIFMLPFRSMCNSRSWKQNKIFINLVAFFLSFFKFFVAFLLDRFCDTILSESNFAIISCMRNGSNIVRISCSGQVVLVEGKFVLVEVLLYD